MRPDTLVIDTSRDLRLLQFTDIHLATWHGGKFAAQASKFVSDAIKTAKPDIIAVTGDLVTCYDPAEVLKEFCDLMDSFGVPWAFCFGNHDRDSVKDPKLLENILENSETCLYRTGDDHVFGYGNYRIKLVNAEGKIIHALYFFDNAWRHIYDGLSGYTCGSLSQNRWFRKCQSELLREYDDFNSWAFVHFPLPEFETAWELNGGVGPKLFKNQSPCINTGLFCTLAEDTTVRGVFCGHDHGTAYVSEYYGLKLIFGIASGYNLSKDGVEVTDVGARLCEISPNGEMTTCFYMDDGTWRDASCEPTDINGGEK